MDDQNNTNLSDNQQPTAPVQSPVVPIVNTAQPKNVKFLSKKIVIAIISTLSLVIVAGGVILALSFFAAKPSTTNDSSNSTEQTVADLSKDYGACDLVNKDFVKTALGSVADNLKGPSNVGRIMIDGGDESQVCVYSFTDEGNLNDNMFNRTNAFSVEVYVFASEDSKTSLLSSIDETDFVESALGESVVYNVLDTSNDYNQYILTVYKDLKSYAFEISQPISEVTFDLETAKVALLAIANSVTY